MVRGVALGLVAGILLGWVFFRVDDTGIRLRRAGAAEPMAARHGVSESTPREASAPEESQAREKFSRDAPVNLTVRRENDELVYLLDGHRIEKRPPSEVALALTVARREKNWPEYYAGMLELVANPSREADEALLEALNDETLNLPNPKVADRLFEGLEHSELEGIASAAMARAKIGIEDTKKIYGAGNGILALVARFGSAEHLDWLQSMATNNTARKEIERALGRGSANPEAARRLKEIFLRGKPRSYNNALELARRNPEAGFELATALLEKSKSNTSAYKMIGLATSEESLDRTVAIYMGVDGERPQIYSLYGVNELHKRGLSTGGLERLIGTPGRLIEETLAGRNGAEVKRAIYVIDYNEVTWTDENLEALRRFGKSRHKYASRARNALQSIERKQLAKRGWEPEREVKSD